MKFVFWVISVLIIAVVCYVLYSLIRKTDGSNKAYFALLRQLEKDPSNEQLQSRVYELGRKYYRNRLTGIDVSIQQDIEKAKRGEIVEELNVE